MFFINATMQRRSVRLAAWFRRCNRNIEKTKCFVCVFCVIINRIPGPSRDMEQRKIAHILYVIYELNKIKLNVQIEFHSHLLSRLISFRSHENTKMSRDYNTEPNGHGANNDIINLTRHYIIFWSFFPFWLSFYAFQVILCVLLSFT